MARRASRRQTAGMTFTKNAHLMPAPDDDSKWRAVLAHDRRADTLFVYGVSSTRIYCRPSCASRRPRRDRVVFFDSPRRRRARAIARAGAAARRRPGRRSLDRQDPPRLRLSRQRRRPRVARASRRAARAAARIISSAVSSASSASRPREYADACRPEKVKRGLRGGERGDRRDVSTPATDRAAAFTSAPRRNSRCRRRSYRRGGAGSAIALRDRRFAAGPAARRGDRLAASARCRWGRRTPSSSARLSASIRPRRSRRTAHESRHVDAADRPPSRGPAPRLDLPLDVQATAFQWQVWKALAAIPYGETRYI